MTEPKQHIKIEKDMIKGEREIRERVKYTETLRV